MKMGLHEPSNFTSHTFKMPEKWLGLHDTGAENNFLLWTCSKSDIVRKKIIISLTCGFDCFSYCLTLFAGVVGD